GALWLAYRQCSGGAGLVLFAERRCLDRRGIDRRVGAALVLAVANSRVPRACRASAGEQRGRIARRSAPSDAVVCGTRWVANSAQGPRPETRRDVGKGTRNRREPQRHRVSAPGALGPVGILPQ